MTAQRTPEEIDARLGPLGGSGGSPSASAEQRDRGWRRSPNRSRWPRISASRRARFRLGSFVLFAAAAVVAIVFGASGLLRRDPAGRSTPREFDAGW